MSKTYTTTIIIETPYDPTEMGSVQLVMDLSSGEAKLKSRVSVPTENDQCSSVADKQTKTSKNKQ